MRREINDVKIYTYVCIISNNDNNCIQSKCNSAMYIKQGAERDKEKERNRIRDQGKEREKSLYC